MDSLGKTPASRYLSLPYAAEASWVTGKWDKLKDYISEYPAKDYNFNVGVGQALLALGNEQSELFCSILEKLRTLTAQGLSSTNTASLQECHESMLKFHVLGEIEAISGASGIENLDQSDKPGIIRSLNQRLDVLGPFFSDKQYILGLRRATMHLSRQVRPATTKTTLILLVETSHDSILLLRG